MQKGNNYLNKRAMELLQEQHNVLEYSNELTTLWSEINFYQLLPTDFATREYILKGRKCWDLRSITFRNFDQNIKCSGKALNRTFKIPSHQEQMILSSSIYEKNILIGIP